MFHPLLWRRTVWAPGLPTFLPTLLPPASQGAIFHTVWTTNLAPGSQPLADPGGRCKAVWTRSSGIWKPTAWFKREEDGNPTIVVTMWSMDGGPRVSVGKHKDPLHGDLRLPG